MTRPVSDTECKLQREVFSRASRLTYTQSSQTGREAIYSGDKPDSAAGGSRWFQTAKRPAAVFLPPKEPRGNLWTKVEDVAATALGFAMICAVFWFVAVLS